MPKLTPPKDKQIINQSAIRQPMKPIRPSSHPSIHLSIGTEIYVYEGFTPDAQLFQQGAVGSHLREGVVCNLARAVEPQDSKRRSAYAQLVFKKSISRTHEGAEVWCMLKSAARSTHPLLTPRARPRHAAPRVRKVPPIVEWSLSDACILR